MIRTIIVLSMILAAVGSVHAQANELERYLRAAVGAPEEARVVWPPAARLSPGDVLARSGEVVELGEAEVDEKPVAATAGPHALAPEMLGSAALWPWRFLADDVSRLALVLRVADVVRAEARGETSSAADRGTRVGTVWRARVSIEVTKGPDLSDERWKALRRAALQDTTETVKVGGFAIRLEPPETIPLAWLPAAGDSGLPTSGAAGRLVAPKRWALMTVASGVYRNLDPSMAQDWNSESARLVREALADWSPTLVNTLDAKPAEGLTRDRVLSFVSDGIRQAKRAKADLVVVYYVGHQARSGTGGLHLLMSDAPRTVQRPAPVTGVGNLRDLARVVDRVTAELVADAGVLDVGVLHRLLTEGGIPFVLLVDGCLEDRSYAAGRDRLGIVVDPRGGEPLFIGPGDAGTALRAMVHQLGNYASDFPWLRYRNPTVLGATPGTLAFAVPNPKWLFGPPIAPIADKLAGVVGRTRGDPDRPSLIRSLSYTADRQPIGPQELSGTVSWSDWLPHLKRFDPASFR